MKTSAEAGFTLVETLVALVIMISVATMLYRGLWVSFETSVSTGIASQALDIAKSKLAAAGTANGIEPGTMQGQEGAMNWTITVQPYATQQDMNYALGLEAFWFTATVNWFDGRSSKPQSVELTTLKLVPKR